MHASLSKFIDKIWYGGSKAALLFLPLAWLYGLLAWLRRTAYTRDLLGRPALPVPVIVVGNISAGGTGKTPIVAWLAEQLRQAGYKPGIVSRGYGVQANTEPALVSSGADPKRYGDEAVLLAELTACPVCICADRVAAVRHIAREDVTVVISDDGLQHYRMQRAYEIAVVDGQRRFGNGFLLPAGPLREPVSRLESVDSVLINGGQGTLAGIRFSLAQGDAVSLADKSVRPLSSFAGQKVWAVAGIGNPERFAAHLRAAGILVDAVFVPDHGTISIADLQTQRRQPVLMTSKDAVKYRHNPLTECWHVPVEVVFSANDATALLSNITAALETGAATERKVV